MGKVALAAKITHVPSLYLSELPGPRHGCRQPAIDGHREIGRRFTTMWVALEVGSRTAIRDALIGFRIYPLASSLGVGRTGDRMDFDVEIAVRLVRAGTPTVNLPVRVHYPTEEEGGVSHFRMFQDNVRFSFLHGRLCTAGCLQWLRRAVTKK